MVSSLIGCENPRCASRTLLGWDSQAQDATGEGFGRILHHWGMRPRVICAFAVLAALLVLTGCPSEPEVLPPPVRTVVEAQDDLIVVSGQYFHCGARVVRWNQSNGYNGYIGSHYDIRKDTSESSGTSGPGITGVWPLDSLRRQVDQFVLHYDGSGTSQRCFRTLQARGLSVHFLLDIDGTIYQTMDLKEKAWHATIANDRSIGIEIANIGSFSLGEPDRFADWYRRDGTLWPRIIVPGSDGHDGILTPGFIGRPIRPRIITSPVQGRVQRQYDFTPQQYQALIQLTATLCQIFPRIRCDYPRDASGSLYTAKLPNPYLAGYSGVLGHYHVQTNKSDPGPALQWDLVIGGARKEMARRAGP